MRRKWDAVSALAGQDAQQVPDAAASGIAADVRRQEI